MRYGRLGMIMACSLIIGGCAATAPSSDDSIKFQASDRATQLIEEQGKASATMLGYADDTDLVCERFYKTGSHITVNFCYTRAEMEQRRLNHQEEWRHFTKGGPCIAPGTSPVGGCGGG